MTARVTTAATTSPAVSAERARSGRASLGAAEWPVQGGDSASVLRRADTAMYQATRNQLGVVWYSPELDADAPRRLDLYLSARSALEREELYSPSLLNPYRLFVTLAPRHS